MDFNAFFKCACKKTIDYNHGALKGHFGSTYIASKCLSCLRSFHFLFSLKSLLFEMVSVETLPLVNLSCLKRHGQTKGESPKEKLQALKVAYRVEHRCKGVVCVWMICEEHTWEENVLFLCKHEAEPMHRSCQTRGSAPLGSGFAPGNLRTARQSHKTHAPSRTKIHNIQFIAEAPRSEAD